MFVVAMASDKDHIGFARELLSGTNFDCTFIFGNLVVFMSIIS